MSRPLRVPWIVEVHRRAGVAWCAAFDPNRAGRRMSQSLDPRGAALASWPGTDHTARATSAGQRMRGSRISAEFRFCRNVLIYFERPTQSAVLARMAALLANDGLLFAGHSENVTSACEAVRPLGKTVYARADDGRADGSLKL